MPARSDQAPCAAPATRPDSVTLLQSWQSETWQQLKYSAPLVFAMALQQLQVVALLASLNQATTAADSTQVLGGVGIAITVINATGYYWIMGLCGGLETLGVLLFGQGRLLELGGVLKTALLVVGTLAAPVALIWLRIGDILTVLGVDAGQSDVAGRFSR